MRSIPLPVPLEITGTFSLTSLGATAEVQVTAKNAGGEVLTGKTFTWSSSDPSVATVNVSGVGSGTASIVVTAVSNGTADITVSADGVSASVTVTVSQVVATIEVTPMDPLTLTDEGETRSLAAVAKDAGGSGMVGVTFTWASDNVAAATVAADGTVTAITDGVANIRASASGVTSNAVEITVALGAVVTVEVTPVGPLTLTSLGATENLTAIARDIVDEIVTGVTFTWASDNEAAATVSSIGTVMAVADGVANVTASVPGVTSNVVEVTVAQAVATVEVTPANDTVLVASTTQLNAQPRDAEANPITGLTITWKTGNPNIATVSGTGLVTGIQQGIVAITATSEGVDGSAAIIVISDDVVASVVVTPATDTIGMGQALQLEAEARDASGTVLVGRVVTWASDNVNVATVDANGLVTGLTVGVVTITGTSEGVSGTSTITVVPASVASVVVTPASATVQVGQTVQLAAEPRDATGTPLSGRAVTWSSNDANIASVGADGVVSGVALGAVTITATSGGVSGTASITVVVAAAGVTVSGTIRYSSTPLEGFQVDLVQGDLETGPSRSVATDANGLYSFGGVPEGQHWVRVNGDGLVYIQWTAQTVEVGTTDVVHDRYLPKIIALSSPSDDAIDVGTRPTLTWDENPEAAAGGHYQVQINETDDGVPLTVEGGGSGESPC